MDTQATLEMFEGQTRRIFWIPGLALGYCYYLSGNEVDLVLSVAAIVGSKYIFDLIDSSLVDSEEMNLHSDAANSLLSNNDLWVNTLLALTLLTYLATVPYSILRLYEVFTHDDLILVGIAVTYASVILVVLLPDILPANSNRETSD